MITQQTQIKINLPVALKEYVESKASQFGITVAAYIKHLILKEVEEMEYPVYKASKRTEEAYKKALKEQKEGKLIRVDNIKKFFDEL